jgi:hypothetical protein
MSDDDKCEYEPVHRSGRWMIQATDEDCEVTFITCGDPTLEQLWANPRFAVRRRSDRQRRRRAAQVSVAELRRATPEPT